MAAVLALALLGMASGILGCGEGGGASAGATVDVYVGAGLCSAAKAELGRNGGRAGDLRVRVLCLEDPQRGKRLDLATVGADARAATEDSAAVAYLEPPGPANRFSQTIVEEAGIAWVIASSGANAAQRVLRAVEAADSGAGSLRDEVRKTLESGL